LIEILNESIKDLDNDLYIMMSELICGFCVCVENHENFEASFKILFSKIIGKFSQLMISRSVPG
jgi:hypothetical protein